MKLEIDNATSVCEPKSECSELGTTRKYLLPCILSQKKLAPANITLGYLTSQGICKWRTIGQEELVTSGANDVFGLVNVSVEVVDGVDDISHLLELRRVQVLHHPFL